MPKGFRPGKVEHWIKCGRPVGLISLSKTDLDSWKTHWWTWWTERQPRERIGNDGSLSQSADRISDWSRLDYHGDNGILAFVIAVYSWGIAAKASEVEIDLLAWLEAVKDVSWCLQHLASERSDEDSSLSSLSGSQISTLRKRYGICPSFLLSH
jgi:hypothetical protein